MTETTRIGASDGAFVPYDEDDASQNPPPDALVSVGELEGADLPDEVDTDLSASGVVLPEGAPS